MVNLFCIADYLELGKYPVPRKTVTNCLQSIVSKPITYNNSLPPRNHALLSKRKVNYFEDILFTRGTSNLGMSRRDVI